MKKQPNESAAAGEDLISDLPDEILHSVLRRIPYFKEAAQTSALSSRWRNLWSSYPVVELDSATSPYYTSHSASPFYPLCRFYSTTSEGFYSFHNATMTKFSRDKLLRIETLKLSVCTYFPFPRSPAIEQLLDLASERKAENIEIKVDSDLFLCLPFGLLSNSSAKIIRLQRIGFLRDNSILISLNSLCSLHLSTVNFDDELLFANLIASSPLLETLELEHVYAPMSKLRLSNVSSLKVLMISSCHWVKEIEIVALALQTLHIQDMDQVFRIELMAPQLSILKTDACDKLRLDVNSELKFLTLCRSCRDLVLPLNSVRFLSLNALALYDEDLNLYDEDSDLYDEDLDIHDKRILSNLLAGFPLLETLELVDIRHLRKVQFSNAPNLKTLKISGCFHLKEIEITAYELRSLHLEGRVDSKHWKNELLKIELTAPQLNVLEITNFDLKMDDLEVMVSKFQSLKSLSLDRCCTTEKRPILSDRELEEFTSSALSGWEKIELDADPWLEKVALRRDA